MNITKLKGNIFYFMPTIGYWKTDYAEIIENGHKVYGLQFNWFKTQILITWEKK